MSASQPPRVHGVAEGTRAEQTAGRMGQTSWNCGYWMEALNFHKNLCRCCCEGCFRCDYHLVGLIWSVDGLKSKYEGCQKKKKFSSSPQHRNHVWMSNLLPCGIQAQNFQINSYLNLQSVSLLTDFRLASAHSHRSQFLKSISLSLSSSLRPD